MLLFNLFQIDGLKNRMLFWPKLLILIVTRVSCKFEGKKRGWLFLKKSSSKVSQVAPISRSFWYYFWWSINFEKLFFMHDFWLTKIVFIIYMLDHICKSFSVIFVLRFGKYWYYKTMILVRNILEASFEYWLF